ncbi:integrase core domain-containing protein [Streptomyces sp. NPDC096142]|uniref:integrase core domain-containing protein n=1 Tax=Streptomyces sp. NPDC096142 TaxID=3366077 RepID=UPI0038241C51
MDLILAYLSGTVPAAAALSPLAADYMEQQASGLLSGAVMLDPGFQLQRRAVMPAAGLAWLETITLGAPVAAAVRALAANSRDNAMAEALNGSFQAKLIEHQGPRRDADKVERAVVQWVGWYNTQRLHSALDYLPSEEFEARHHRSQAAGHR